jgi:murein DD-endopeptidase MepM/ murein hydrolase activator NlpD
MPFIMISAGTTSSARIRTLSLRSLAIGGGLAMAALFAGGVGLGHWWSAMVSAPAGAAAPQAPSAALPFALEQLGALSGRLFKLESQAGQLSERIGVSTKAAPQAPSKRVEKPMDAVGRGGPWLPPRPQPDALGSLAELETRLALVEHQIGLVADAASLQNLDQLRMPTRIPVSSYELSSGFGNREDPFTGRSAFHAGLDFAAPLGTTIHAAAGGKVSFAGQKTDFGWVVEIEHGNGLVTRYAHASRLFVKAGDLVLPGDAIAAVGSTGRSTGAHLHFEVLRGGEAVDPRRYLAGL